MLSHQNLFPRRRPGSSPTVSTGPRPSPGNASF